MEKTDWDRYPYMESKSLDLFYKAAINGYKELMKSIKEPITSVLELGAGTGKITHELAKTYRIEKITLVDSNEKAIATAKKVFKGNDNVEIIHEDLFDVSYEKEYDLVHSQGLIEHFSGEEQQKLVNIHANLARSGGYVIIFVPAPTRLYKMSRTVAEKSGQWIFKDEVPMTKEQLQSLGEKANLKYIDHAYIRAIFPEVGILFKKE